MTIAENINEVKDSAYTISADQPESDERLVSDLATPEGRK